MKLAAPDDVFELIDSYVAAAAGPRVPDSAAEDKHYRTGWIMIHLPGDPPNVGQRAKAVAIHEQQQIDWSFSSLSRGTMDHSLFDDCNCNDVPDADDIAGGTSPDVNNNGIPDECEAAGIPTVSEWGLLVMGASLLAAGLVVLRRYDPSATTTELRTLHWLLEEPVGNQNRIFSNSILLLRSSRLKWVYRLVVWRETCPTHSAAWSQVKPPATQMEMSEVFTDREYLEVKGQLDTDLRKVDQHIQRKRAELETCSADAAKQLVHSLAMPRLGERKLSASQRAELFRALVRRITPQDDTLRVCEIELNANIEPQIAEGPACTRTENLTSR